MDNEDNIILTTTLAEIKVKIDNKDYTVRELCGKLRDDYMNLNAKRITVDVNTGKAQAIKDFSNYESELVALSLFDDKGEAVTLEKINSWPASVVGKLHRLARKVSGLDKSAEKIAKNESGENVATGSASPAS